MVRQRWGFSNRMLDNASYWYAVGLSRRPIASYHGAPVLKIPLAQQSLRVIAGEWGSLMALFTVRVGSLDQALTCWHRPGVGTKIRYSREPARLRTGPGGRNAATVREVPYLIDALQHLLIPTICTAPQRLSSSRRRVRVTLRWGRCRLRHCHAGRGRHSVVYLSATGTGRRRLSRPMPSRIRQRLAVGQRRLHLQQVCRFVR